MTEQTSLPAAVLSGLAGRCPRCRQGKMFSGLLTLRRKCEACGLDYSFADAGDGPAIFVILLSGFIVVAAALIVAIRRRAAKTV